MADPSNSAPSLRQYHYILSFNHVTKNIVSNRSGKIHTMNYHDLTIHCRDIRKMNKPIIITKQYPQHLVFFHISSPSLQVSFLSSQG